MRLLALLFKCFLEFRQVGWVGIDFGFFLLDSGKNGVCQMRRSGRLWYSGCRKDSLFECEEPCAITLP